MRVAILHQRVDSIDAEVEIVNQRSTPLNFAKGLNGETTTIVFSIEKEKQIIKSDPVAPLTTILLPSDSFKTNVRIPLKDIAAGDYFLYMGIRNGVLPDAVLSEGISFKVKK